MPDKNHYHPDDDDQVEQYDDKDGSKKGTEENTRMFVEAAKEGRGKGCECVFEHVRERNGQDTFGKGEAMSRLTIQ